MGLIFRNDDVSMASNFAHIENIYDFLEQTFPESIIWSCVNIFSRGKCGSVYPDLPLSGQPIEYFYDVDRAWMEPEFFKDMASRQSHKVVSHGLFHIKHKDMPFEMQRQSIVASCRLLKTDIFVPPFTNYNKDTEIICDENKIVLSTDTDGWKSLESTPFDPTHEKWFFHSWRFTPETFKNLFGAAK